MTTPYDFRDYAEWCANGSRTENHLWENSYIVRYAPAIARNWQWRLPNRKEALEGFWRDLASFVSAALLRHFKLSESAQTSYGVSDEIVDRRLDLQLFLVTELLPELSYAFPVNKVGLILCRVTTVYLPAILMILELRRRGIAIGYHSLTAPYDVTSVRTFLARHGSYLVKYSIWCAANRPPIIEFLTQHNWLKPKSLTRTVNRYLVIFATLDACVYTSLPSASRGFVQAKHHSLYGFTTPTEVEKTESIARTPLQPIYFL